MDGPLSSVLERCSFCTDMYIPVPWLASGRAQTAAAVHNRSYGPADSSFQREILKAPNGSTVGIDWFDHPEDMNKKFAGLLIILNHGCNGCLLWPHLEAARGRAADFGLGCCVVTLQGVGGVPVTSPNVGFGLSFLVELKAIMERVNQHVGAHFPKVAMAFSLGGVPLVEFIGQEKTAFFSCAFVSLPMNLEKFCLAENAVTEHCLVEAKKLLKTNSEFLTGWNLASSTRALDASSLTEFFDAIRQKAPTSGLYTAVNPAVTIDAIARPSLFVYAADDAAVEFYESVDLARMCRNRNIAVCVTENGGHCGFRTLTDSWLANACLDFLSSTVKP